MNEVEQKLELLEKALEDEAWGPAAIVAGEILVDLCGLAGYDAQKVLVLYQVFGGSNPDWRVEIASDGKAVSDV